jgi:thiol-disulfide isomerase/thioredoxin
VKNRTLIASGLAALVGVLAFAIIQIASVGKDGVKMGFKQAAASCSGKSPDCLPKLTMLDADGRKWAPEALTGKVVVVNVWATWCKPCMAEIPDLADVYRRYANKDVRMFGLLAEYGMTVPQVQQISRQVGVNYPVVFMEPEIGEAFDNPSVLPTTFVYDRNGKLHSRHRGEISREELEQEIDLLLGE